MIEVRDLEKIYKGCDGEVRAVDGVSLSIRGGEFVIILGRSGSGKSTLLSLLSGLVKPTRGTVSLKGKDIWALSDKELSLVRGKDIGFVFQFSGLLPTLSTLENVMVPGLFVPGRNNVAARARELLDAVGVGGRADAFPCTLSAGNSSVPRLPGPS